MIERLKLIMSVKNLSPTQLAEAIGVQRSGISHILSGRNKPSLDFVLKVLAAFTDVNEAWLLTASGEMLKSNNKSPELFTDEKKPLKETVEPIQVMNSLKSEEEPYYKADSVSTDVGIQQKSPEKKGIMDNLATDLKSTDKKNIELGKGEKRLVKLIAIYSDDSFKVYHAE